MTRPGIEPRSSGPLANTLTVMSISGTTLNRIDQLPELTVSLAEHNIDIVCIQEDRYYHSRHDTGSKWTFVSVSARKNSVNAIIGGVRILLSPHTLKSLNSIEKIRLRMMIAIFNGKPLTTIICYSPTNDNDKTGLITFFNELSSLVHSISKHNVLIISGDMNA